MNVFERKSLDFIEKNELVASGQRVLVACSGGVDSVALLLFLESFRNKLQIDIGVAHVDHMLRGEESAEDGRFVAKLCNKLGIPFFGGRVPVPEILSEQGGNMQDVCREGRYRFFKEVMRAQGYAILATAHHAEDQLETVLMQISKGSNPVGIPIKRIIDEGIVVRPILPIMKHELLDYVAKKDMHFREDPSNESDAYFRNRLRHRVAPILLSENPSTAVNVVKMTTDLQNDNRLLDSLTKERFKDIVSFTKEGLPSFSVNLFLGMHTALQTRFIPLVLKYLYDGESTPVEYNTALLNELLHQLSTDHGNVTIDLPRGYRFQREYDQVSFIKATEDEVRPPTMLKVGEWTTWGDVQLYWNDLDKDVEDASEKWYFNLPDSELPLYVRSRHDGDRILLPGMTQTKRLSRLFIDEKIGAERRRELPVVITANDEICAIPGVRFGIQFKKRQTELDQYIFRMKKL